MEGTLTNMNSHNLFPDCNAVLPEVLELLKKKIAFFTQHNYSKNPYLYLIK